MMVLIKTAETTNEWNLQQPPTGQRTNPGISHQPPQVMLLIINQYMHLPIKVLLDLAGAACLRCIRTPPLTSPWEKTGVWLRVYTQIHSSCSTVLYQREQSPRRVNCQFESQQPVSYSQSHLLLNTQEPPT